MESPDMAKTFKYNSTVTETSLHYRSFAQTRHKNLLRDTSFNSYLPPEDPKLASQYTMEDTEISIFDAKKYFNESNDPKTPGSNNGIPILERNTGADVSSVQHLSSLSSVDGYGRNRRVRSFHATPTASSEASWNSQAGLLSNPPGCISVSLRNVSANHERKIRGPSSGAKWFLSNKCPCSGKKSVQVEETASEPRSTAAAADVDDINNSKAILHMKRQIKNTDDGILEKVLSNKSLNSSAPNDLMVGTEENVILSPQKLVPHHYHRTLLASGRPFIDGTGGFSFPILNTSTEAKNLQPKSNTSPTEDPPRESMEVFQPLEESISRRSSIDFQRTLASSHNAIDSGAGGRDPRFFAYLGSPISRVTATDEDVASDASSDLFEIESFSTQATSYQLHRRRDSLDDAHNFNSTRRFNGTYYSRRSLDEPMTPSVAPTECYAPSEASIDWSVTTAEGFDKASITNFSISASEFGDVVVSRHGAGTGGQNAHDGGGGNGGQKRKGNGLLLSCRHERAVSVGPQPVRCGMEGQKQVGQCLPQVSTVGHVNSSSSSSRQQANNHNHKKPPLARSHSARLSLAFAA